MARMQLLGSIFVGLLVAGLSAPVVGAEPAAQGYTVADLVVRLAEEMGVAEAQQSPEAGRAFLVAAGVEVSGDLDRRLDEAQTVAIFNQLGANVTTSNPGGAIDGPTIDRLLAVTLPDGLPSLQAEGCKGGAGCDPHGWLKQFCKNHPNLCKKVASHFGH